VLQPFLLHDISDISVLDVIMNKEEVAEEDV
jgi:hypothetical protein